MKILFTGGGTGGHLTPIIAVCREIRKMYSKEKLEFFFIGPDDNFSDLLLSGEGIKIRNVLSGKIRRYGKWNVFFQNLFDVAVKIPIGVIQSFFLIFFMSPDVVFSRGGFGSIPAVLASKILLIPVYIHESDVIPGVATKFLSRFAKEIFVSFPKTEYFPIKKTFVTGNPIRKELLTGSLKEARKLFKLQSKKPVILVLGGSQGAQRINDKILEVLPDLLDKFEIIHQCGEKNFRQVREESKVVASLEILKSYHLFPFLREPEIREAYAASNLIISRSGSGSIFEIAAIAKPSILIPLPESAQNHQVENAYAFSEKGAAIVMEEANFTPHFFLERLKFLFSNPGELEKMAKAAKDFSKPESGRIIANRLQLKLKS
ncbi:MAG: undecaprenyldiphospho-muramoylpentapeptide beta-N-acetylglucosaminyltransferase [Candidatus Nealsonbacteria bacterium]